MRIGAPTLEGPVTVISTNAAVAGPMKFFEASGNGVMSIALQAPASVSADVVLTLPGTDGNASQVLSTDGAGILSWVDSVTGISSYSISTVATVSTTSSTYAQVSTLTVTPAAGTYIVIFNAGVGNSVMTTLYAGNIAIAVAGTNVAASVRSCSISQPGASMLTSFGQSASCQVTVNGSQTVQAMFNATSSTVQVKNGTLLLIKI